MSDSSNASGINSLTGTLFIFKGITTESDSPSYPVITTFSPSVEYKTPSGVRPVVTPLAISS